MHPILKHFRFEHLPQRLQDVSKPFGWIANEIATTLPACGQLDVALQKLLEAKDAAVRAKLEDNS